MSSWLFLDVYLLAVILARSNFVTNTLTLALHLLKRQVWTALLSVYLMILNQSIVYKYALK